MSFLQRLSGLSDHAKLTIGFASLILAAAIGIAAIFSAIAPNVPAGTYDQTTSTAGEVYAQELLFHEVAQFPADAVAIEELPGEPTRYYLLRSYVDAQDIDTIAALRHPYEEPEQ